LDVHRKITDFINDEYPVLGQDLEFIGQTILKVSFLQLLNQLVAVDIVGGEAVPCGYTAEGGGQVGLAHAGRAQEYHILAVFQETHSSQLVDLTLVNGGLEGKIEVVQGLLE